MSSSFFLLGGSRGFSFLSFLSRDSFTSFFGAGEFLLGGGGGAGLLTRDICGIGDLPLDGGGTGGPLDDARDGGGGGASLSEEMSDVVDDMAELVPREL